MSKRSSPECEASPKKQKSSDTDYFYFVTLDDGDDVSQYCILPGQLSQAECDVLIAWGNSGSYSILDDMFGYGQSGCPRRSKGVSGQPLTHEELAEHRKLAYRFGLVFFNEVSWPVLRKSESGEETTETVCATKEDLGAKFAKMSHGAMREVPGPTRMIRLYSH